MSKDRAKSIRIDSGEDQSERFRNLKQESRERLGMSEMTHPEFLKLLLDVWEDNLNMVHDEFPDCPECESDVFVGGIGNSDADFRCYLCDVTFSE